MIILLLTSYVSGAPVLCSDDITIYMGVLFDNHLKFENLSEIKSLQKYSVLQVHEDPSVFVGDDQLYRTWWPNKPGEITIEVSLVQIRLVR